MVMLIIKLSFALGVLPFFLHGTIQRTKALWSGRKGPPLFQLLFDVIRLLRKQSLSGDGVTHVFRLGPWVFLATSLAVVPLVPLWGGDSLVSFRYDFVWLAYVWALGRGALILAALDTGSSFQGMGAAREATFSALLEPALFCVFGALCLGSGAHSLGEAVHGAGSSVSPVVWALSVCALLLITQVETGRIPVGDSATHLELTMVHEVMVLDHCGPDLAAIQWGLALKLMVTTSLVASLLNPLGGTSTGIAALAQLGFCLLIAVLFGTVESLVGRLKMRAIPSYIAIALAMSAVGLLATAWRPMVQP
jgi:formate hydrogenlyase subunit 4